MAAGSAGHAVFAAAGKAAASIGNNSVWINDRMLGGESLCMASIDAVRGVL